MHYFHPISRNPTTDKVIEFPKEYIAKNGITKRMRTDPGRFLGVKNSNHFA